MRHPRTRPLPTFAFLLLALAGCHGDGLLAPDDTLRPTAALGAPEEVCATVDFDALAHGDAVSELSIPELDLTFSVTVWPSNGGLPRARAYDTDVPASSGDAFLAWNGDGAGCPACQGLGRVLVVEDGAGFAAGGASDFGGTFFLDGFTQTDVRLRSVNAVSASFEASHQVWVDADQLAISSEAMGAVQALVPSSEPPITSFVELVVLSSAQGGFDDLQLCRMMETAEDPGESEQGGEGCSVSFWKEPGNTAAWNETGILPDARLAVLLGAAPDELANPEQNLAPSELSIAEALRLRGSKVNRLVREAAAAYLNSLSPDVSFDLTAAEVETIFRGGLDGDDEKTATKTLAGFNHQVCPLD